MKNISTKIFARHTNTIVICFVALLTLLLIILVRHYGVNTPYQDQFELVPLMQKFQSGSLHLGDFWVQHNEHRMFFPQIVLLALAVLTHWHIKLEMFTSIFFAVIGIGLYLYILRKTITNKLLFLACALPATLLCLSPIQSENLLWGWQIEWFMITAAVLGSVFFLYLFSNAKQEREKLIFFVLSIASSVIAAYSLGSGLLLFPIVFVQLLITHRKERRYIIGWGVATIAVFGIYYYQYVKPQQLSYLQVVRSYTIDLAHYWLSYLGNSISPKASLAYLVGLGLVVLFAGLLYLSIRLGAGKKAQWFAVMGFFALGSAGGTALSRVVMGVDQALAGRYITTSLLLVMAIIGLLGLCYQGMQNKRLARYLIGLCLILLTIAIAAGYIKGIKQMRNDREFKTGLKICALAKAYSPCLLQMYPSTEIAQERLEYMYQNNIGPFR